MIHRGSDDNTIGGAKLKIQGVVRLLNLKQFAQVEEILMYEDNATYLRDFCDALAARIESVRGHYYPSNQGH